MPLTCPSTLPTTILHTACSHSMSPRQERWKIKCIYTVKRDPEWNKPKAWDNHSKKVLTPPRPCVLEVQR